MRVLAAVGLLAVGGCDRAPWRTAKTSACAVRGIDVSRHQQAIDWSAVAASGVAFAWIKATEGGDFRDLLFRRNWYLAAAAGVKRGAYHFVTWCRPAADQAAWFVANVAADPDALPPVLDVEWNSRSRSCARHAPREEALATMTIILAAMEKAYGKVPVIYAPLDFYQEVMRGSLDRYPLWARSIDDPPFGYGDRRWRIWQYSETGAVPGVAGDVDLDCFSGGEAEWSAWLSNPAG
jgi:lysozyme